MSKTGRGQPPALACKTEKTGRSWSAIPRGCSKKMLLKYASYLFMTKGV